jgi:hypothetical protein
MNVTWVILEKNKEIYKYKLLDNAHVFDKDLMNLQIEGWNTDVPMDYDDIICIKTEDYYQEYVGELPSSLREIYIKYSELREVPLFNENIEKIQIFNSKIEMTDDKMNELRGFYPKAKISISSNSFMEKRYVNYNLRNNHLREGPMYDIDIGLREPDDNVLNSSQTVHLTSINKCILTAIKIIKIESSKYPTVLNPIQKLFIEEMIMFKKDEKTDNDLIHYIKSLHESWYGKKNEKSKREKLKKQIEKWYSSEETHSVHKCSFKSLFIMIMTIIENHEQKEDVKNRLITELEDSVGLCFTGRINRMVNSLVGFIDNIQVGVSTKEEIQMKISIIIQNLNHKKINKKKAKEEMIEMFSHVSEKDNISNHFKEENLVALDECFDDDEEEKEEEKEEESSMLLLEGIQKLYTVNEEIA